MQNVLFVFKLQAQPRKISVFTSHDLEHLSIPKREEYITILRFLS